MNEKKARLARKVAVLLVERMPSYARGKNAAALRLRLEQLWRAALSNGSHRERGKVAARVRRILAGRQTVDIRHVLE